MQKEIWKDVPNYEGLYQVSSFGNVKSLKRTIYRKCGRIHYTKSEKNLVLVKDKIYYKVTLYKNAIKKCFCIHQIIGISFLDKDYIKKGLVVDHIDNNPLNNLLDNLQIITVRLNSSKDKVGYSSIYTGVSWCKATNKWKSVIINKSDYIYLGVFRCELSAYYAYIKKLNQINKHNANNRNN